ncbi:MAG TPA: IS200/IS605 family transposase [Ohtaekwangia sp.]
MANTYTQLHIHAVFAVKYRAGLIQPEWKNDLYKYITGIVQMHNHKMLIINGMPDHVHMFFGMRPTQSLSELIQDVKGNSSKWINENNFIHSRFEWQEGYGAFSYSKSQGDMVISYILDQEIHHRSKSFKEEYVDMLNTFEVGYDERYLFKPLE